MPAIHRFQTPAPLRKARRAVAELLEVPQVGEDARLGAGETLFEHPLQRRQTRRRKLPIAVQLIEVAIP